jgi:hypothetical protein
MRGRISYIKTTNSLIENTQFLTHVAVSRNIWHKCYLNGTFGITQISLIGASFNWMKRLTRLGMPHDSNEGDLLEEHKL